nr:GGDEF domain-containing protein [Pacificimonas flava]
MAGEVARVRSELEQRVARRTFELEAANHKLRLLSERDMLTDLPNRRKIMDDFAAMWGAYDRMAVILLDVDHFKSINDRHGHPGGDAVLKQVAGRLAGALRHGSLLGRVGGEEFMVVAPVRGYEEADALAARLRAVVAADPVTVAAGESLPVTISVGVALRSAADTQDGIYARADANLYQAKKAGRDIVCREGRIFKTAGAVQAQRMRIVKS